MSYIRGTNGFYDYYETLDEDQIKMLEEAEKLHEELMQKEDLTLSEFSNIYKINAMLQGSPNHYSGMTDTEIYNKVRAFGKSHDRELSERVIKGGVFHGKYDYWSYDIGGTTYTSEIKLPVKLAANIADVGRNIRSYDYIESGLKPLLERDDQSWADYYNEMATMKVGDAGFLDKLGAAGQGQPFRAEDDEYLYPVDKRIQYKKAAEEYESKIKTAIYNELKISYPDASNDEIDIIYYGIMSKAESEGTDISAALIKSYRHNKDLADKYMTNNPLAQGAIEWHAGEEVGTADWLTDVISGAISSRAFINTVQGAAIWAARTPGVPKKVRAFAGAISAIGAGYYMEAGSYLFSEAERAEQDQLVNEEYVNNSSELIKQELLKRHPEFRDGKAVFIEAFGRKMTFSQMHKLIMDQNYRQEPDGRWVKKGLDPVTALTNNIGAHQLYGSVAGLIENFSNMGTIKKLAGTRNVKRINQWFGYRTYRAIANNLEKKVRTLPIDASKGAKILAYGQQHGFEAITQAGVEGLEEVLQGITQSVIATGDNNLKNDWRYPEFKFGEHHGGWKQVRDEFVGGAGAGGVSGLITGGKILTGWNERLENKTLGQEIRSEEGTGFEVKKRSWRERRKIAKEKGIPIKKVSKFYLNAVVTERNKETGQLDTTVLNIPEGDLELKDKDGNIMDLNFNNFGEAYSAAKVLTQSEAVKTNKIKAWNYRKLRNGKIDIVKGDEKLGQDPEKFYINVLDNSGEIYFTDEASFKNEGKAKKHSFRYEQFIENVKENYDKYGGINLKKDRVILEQQKEFVENIDIDNHSLDSGGGTGGETVMNTLSEEERGNKNGIMIGLFGDDNFYGASDTVNQIIHEINKPDSEEQLYDNPDTIIKAIKENPEQLRYRKIPVKKIMDTFDTLFKEHKDYKKKRKELEKVVAPILEENHELETPKPLEDKVDKAPDVEEAPKVTEKAPTEEDLLIDEQLIEPEAEESGALQVEEIPTEEPFPTEEPPPSETEQLIMDFQDIEAAKDFEEQQKASEDYGPITNEDLTDKELADKILETKTNLEKVKKGSNTEKRLKLDMESFLKEKERRKSKKIERKKIPGERETTFGDRDERKKRINKQKMTKILNMLVEKFKVTGTFDKMEYDFIDDSTLGESASIKGNKVTINLAFIDPTSPFHEFSHPFLRMVRLDNEKLFDGIWKDIMSEKKWQKLEEKLRPDYMDLYEKDMGAYREEILAHVLELLSENGTWYSKSTNKVIAAFRRFFNALAKMLGINTQIDVHARLLGPDTTLQDIANIITDASNTYRIHVNDTAFLEMQDLANEETPNTPETNFEIMDTQESRDIPSITNENLEIHHEMQNNEINERINLNNISPEASKEDIKKEIKKEIKDYIEWLTERYGTKYKSFKGKQFKQHINQWVKDNFNIIENLAGQIGNSVIFEDSAGNDVYIKIKDGLSSIPKELRNTLEVKALIKAKNIFEGMPDRIKELGPEMRDSWGQVIASQLLLDDLVTFNYQIVEFLLKPENQEEIFVVNPESKDGLHKLLDNIKGRPERKYIDINDPQEIAEAKKQIAKGNFENYRVGQKGKVKTIRLESPEEIKEAIKQIKAGNKEYHMGQNKKTGEKFYTRKIAGEPISYVRIEYGKTGKEYQLIIDFQKFYLKKFKYGMRGTGAMLAEAFQEYADKEQNLFFTKTQRHNYDETVIKHENYHQDIEKIDVENQDNIEVYQMAAHWGNAFIVGQGHTFKALDNGGAAWWYGVLIDKQGNVHLHELQADPYKGTSLKTLKKNLAHASGVLTTEDTLFRALGKDEYMQRYNQGAINSNVAKLIDNKEVLEKALNLASQDIRDDKNKSKNFNGQDDGINDILHILGGLSQASFTASIKGLESHPLFIEALSGLGAMGNKIQDLKSLEWVKNYLEMKHKQNLLMPGDQLNSTRKIKNILLNPNLHVTHLPGYGIGRGNKGAQDWIDLIFTMWMSDKGRQDILNSKDINKVKPLLKELDELKNYIIDNLEIDSIGDEIIGELGNIKGSLRHWIDNLRNKKFNIAHLDFVKNISNAAFDTRPESRQKRADLMEVLYWFWNKESQIESYPPAFKGLKFVKDEIFFKDFPNKDNIIYKQFERNHEYYLKMTKDRTHKNLQYHNDTIFNAMIDFYDKLEVHNREYGETDLEVMVGELQSITGIPIGVAGNEGGLDILNKLITRNGNVRMYMWEKVDGVHQRGEMHKNWKKIQFGSRRDHDKKVKNYKFIYKPRMKNLNFHADNILGDISTKLSPTGERWKSKKEMEISNIKAFLKIQAKQRIEEYIRRVVPYVQDMFENKVAVQIQVDKKLEIPDNIADVDDVTIPAFDISMEDIYKEMRGYDEAQNLLDFHEKHVPITLVHALKHAFLHKGPNGKVYFHTGGGSTILQNGAGASPQYYIKEERQFYNLHKALKNNMFGEDGKDLLKEKDDEGQTLGKYIAEKFGQREIDGIPDFIYAFQENPFEGWGRYEFNGLGIMGLSRRVGDYNLSTKESWDFDNDIVKWLLTKAENKDFFKILMNHIDWEIPIKEKYKKDIPKKLRKAPFFTLTRKGDTMENIMSDKLTAIDRSILKKGQKHLELDLFKRHFLNKEDNLVFINWNASGIEEVFKNNDINIDKLINSLMYMDKKIAEKAGFKNSHLISADDVIDYKAKAENGHVIAALLKLPKDKANYGIDVKLSFPDNIQTPSWEIVYKDEKRLIPRRYKKIQKNHELDKTRPTSEDHLRIVTTRAIEIKNLSERTEEKRIINNLFEDTWKHLTRINPGYKVDIFTFKNFMMGTSIQNAIIHGDLALAFEEWFYNKFQDVVTEKDPKYIRTLENRYKWMSSQDIHDEVLEVYDSVEESISSMMERGSTNFKELGINSILYFPPLGRTLSKGQFAKIITYARNETNFDEFKKRALPFVGIPSIKMSKKDEGELLIWYLSSRSAISANGPIAIHEGVPKTLNQRNNYDIHKEYVWDESAIVEGKDKPGAWIFWKHDIQLKGPENRDSGSQNNQWEQATIYEFNTDLIADSPRFSFISGGDVKTHDKVKGWVKSWQFFTSEELVALENTLRKRKQPMTIVFNRGDSKKLAITEITSYAINEAKNALNYWSRQRFINNREESIKELTSGSLIDKAAMIARHEAMKTVWPRYLEYNASTVLKRIKLPFTPGLFSHLMPPVRVSRFDPKKVLFQYGEETPFSPVKKIFGRDVYMGDGNTISSASLFNLFSTNFGLAPGLGKAKTAIYEKRGDNILAIKHAHIKAKRNWKILDKRTKQVLYEIDNDSEIYYGPAHPSYTEPVIEQGIAVDPSINFVHFLATNDEVKVGEVFDAEGNDIMISGQSMVFTKMDNEIKKETVYPMQWHNYVQDDRIAEYFEEKLLPATHRQISAAIYLSLNEGGRLSHESILKFLSKIVGKDNVGYMPQAYELAKLGAGLHPSISKLIDKIVQSQLIQPALKLGNSPGTLLDISMDVTNNLARNEISIAHKNAKFLDLNMGLDEMNEYLKENEVYVLVSRSPVTNKNGAYMARIVSVHGRDNVADLHYLNVKEDLEADGDGDEIHIQSLDEEGTALYRDYFENNKIKPISLDDFSSEVNYKITSSRETLRTILSLIAGQNAISEIAILQNVYGMLVHNYEKINFYGHGEITIPKPSDKVTFNQAIYKGKKGRWEGSIEDYLRIWVQAALDNNEYGFLHEWGYGRHSMFTGPQMLMYKILSANKEGVPISIQWFEKFWEHIYSHYRNVRVIRSGQTHQDGKFSFKQSISLSQDIIAARENNFYLEGIGELTERKGRETMHPLEHIAESPANVLQRIVNNFDLTGFNITPFELSLNMHKNAHQAAEEYLNEHIVSIIEKKIEQDRKLGNIKEGVNISKYKQEQSILGGRYIRGMGQEFFDLLVGMKKINPSTIDRNSKIDDFKIKWFKEYKNLSELAKLVATFEFIRGYQGVNNKLQAIKGNKEINPEHIASIHEELGEGAAMVYGAEWFMAIPSTSKDKKEITLLDPGIMNVFFREYNKIATDKDFRKKFQHNKIKRKPVYDTIDDYLEKACR